MTTEYDTVSFILALEAGELDREEIVAGMQQLINNGMAFQLQGAYGRLAQQLIESGECTPRNQVAT